MISKQTLKEIDDGTILNRLEVAKNLISPDILIHVKRTKETLLLSEVIKRIKERQLHYLDYSKSLMDWCDEIPEHRKGIIEHYERTIMEFLVLYQKKESKNIDTIQFLTEKLKLKEDELKLVEKKNTEFNLLKKSNEEILEQLKMLQPKEEVKKTTIGDGEKKGGVNKQRKK